MIMPFPGHALKRKECAVSLPFPFLTGQEAAMAGAGTATLGRRDGSHVLRLAETTSSGCLPLDHYVRESKTSVLFKSQYFGVL